MRFALLQVLLFLIIDFVNGQNFRLSGKVIDSENSEELPYANIMVKNHLVGTSSDLYGSFEIVLSDSLINDSLIVTYVGYSPLVFCLRDFESGIIKLLPLDTKINEVVIKPSDKKIKPIILNQFNKNNCSVRYKPVNYDAELWIPNRPQEPTIEALYFPYTNEYKGNRRLKEVRLQISNYKTPPTYFNLRILRASKDLMPDEDLLNELLTIEVSEKDQLIKIDLEKYNLIIPENGIFVGFELLIIDENKSILHVENDSSCILFSPYLNFFRIKEEQHFWLYSKGRWIETFQETPNHTKKHEMLFYKPAISLILSN